MAATEIVLLTVTDEKSGRGAVRKVVVKEGSSLFNLHRVVQFCFKKVGTASALRARGGEFGLGCQPQRRRPGGLSTTQYVPRHFPRKFLLEIPLLQNALFPRRSCLRALPSPNPPTL